MSEIITTMTTISKGNLPARLPISSTILYTFLMYYFNVDGVYWGVYITIMFIWWLITIIALYKQKSVDIFQATHRSEY